LVVPLSAAEMVALTKADCPVVAMVKVAEDEPAATLTLAGTVALALLEDRLIVAPPDGAALLSVTVPVALFPPTMDVGEIPTPESKGV